jgi:trk system potassium uptake protein TrkA
MQVIIAGCCQVGSELARTLSAEGHRVAIIDRDPSAFGRLGPEFGGLMVRGIVCDEQVLRQAGIETADVFVAATGSDGESAAAALMARETFGVERVVCQLREPSHESVYQQLGLDTVTSSTLVASKIRGDLPSTGFAVVVPVADGQGEVIRFHPTSGVAGRRVAEVEEQGRFRIAAILRGGQGETLVIPTAQTELAAADTLLAVIESAALPQLRERFGF